MTEKEIYLSLEWAKTEGWNPGIYDAQSFYQADKNGFFVGEINGELVGCISAVIYSPNYAFLGFYLVKPEFRGLGYGLQLWEKAISYVGKERNIGLDAAVLLEKKYQKYGFKSIYKNIRYQGFTGGMIPKGLMDIADFPFSQTLAYDAQFFGCQRHNLLKSWLKQPETITLGIVKQGPIMGYGCIRPSYFGYRIGPLFANNRDVAGKILQGLLAQKTETPVFLDIPEVNSDAIALAESHNMQPVLENIRMYTKKAPDLPLNGIFATTNLELG